MSLQCPTTSSRPIQAVQSTWFGPAIAALIVRTPYAILFWTTKSVTSGVSDAYIEPDANRQILSGNARVLKETELFCEAGLPGMLFSIVGVSVFVPFIRVDHEGDESIYPK